MSDRLRDKVALVSGAGSSGPGWGNGKATALLFAREGGKVLQPISISMRRMGDAWDVAYAALFLAFDEAKYITGTELVVDGGLTVNCV